jgi:hypothetical protein
VQTFTLEEANALLVEVAPLVERMVERKRAFDQAEAEREELLGQIAGNGGDLTPSDVAEAGNRVAEEAAVLAALVEEIQEHGVQVKDLDLGLVDFPAIRDGDVVLLCWRLGEEEIAFWHGTDEGYAGRKPL